MVYLERWKILLIVAICVLGTLYAAPNFLSRDQQQWVQAHTPGFFPNQGVNLGLDLRGGSYLLLEVAVDDVVNEHMQGLVDQVRTALHGIKGKVGYTNLSLGKDGVHFTLTDPTQTDDVRAAMRDLGADITTSISGTDFTVRMTDAAIADRKLGAMGQSIEIVRRRIDETGTREPSIQQQGENRILVQLPGVDDPQRIKNLLGQTAKLTFRLVDEGATAAGAQAGHNPPGTEILPSTEVQGQNYVVEKRVMVSGDTLTDAQPAPSSQVSGDWVVSFKFDSIGGHRFGEATRTNVGHLFAIVLDNKVISAPVIREPILGGAGEISGKFTAQSAQDLALLLRAGALPAPIKILEERTVGPGLGADSIKAGATASLIGLALVVVFFVLAYGLFGIFANIALLFDIALIFAVLSVLQATLTLPGIAGIVLTIGTALDANVLVFERIREEIRLGRSPISAIDAGYSRALSAIIDANMTTLIAAFLLLIFGSGPVKGFGVTLSIGILTSIFSAVMVTRLIVVVWLRVTEPKEIPI
jgi:preprotein translocase subunit SecD